MYNKHKTFILNINCDLNKVVYCLWCKLYIRLLDLYMLIVLPGVIVNVTFTIEIPLWALISIMTPLIASMARNIQ